MQKLISIAVSGLALISLPTLAESKNVKPNKITCQEFVELDEASRPQLVYFIEGATRTGHKEDMVITLEEPANPVAWVLDECNKTPKVTVWQKVENYVHKMTKKL